MMLHNNDPIQQDSERQAIRIFFKNLFSSRPDLDFETDACVFQFGDETLLFSTDEFSSEDNFRDHDPYTLGWNVAAATLSDILAAGGLPLFYGHSVTLKRGWDEIFIGRFSQGIARCLRIAGVDFLGGDIGMSERWSYVGIALGRQISPVSRKGAVAGDAIYLTGMTGPGNLEAALKLYSGKTALKPLLNRINVCFSVRMEESELVRKYAHCCMDTSDGLLRALLDISRINRTGFKISNIPYCRDGLIACKLLSKPKELLFMGECGEYELLFTVPPEREKAFLSEADAKNLPFSRLGEITGDDRMVYEDNRTIIDLSGYNLYARNFSQVGEYIDNLIQFIKDAKQNKHQRIGMQAGASGFIGGHVTRFLTEKGLEVSCLVRESSDTSFLKDLPVRIIKGNIRDNALLIRACSGMDGIMHTAAKVNDWGTYKEFYDVNVQGTLNVLDAASRNGIKKVIITGSNSSYGEENYKGIKNEDSPYHSHYH